jgi:hypothetical protein
MDPGLAWSFLGMGLFGQAVALALARRPFRLIRAGGRARGLFLESEGERVSGAHGAARLTYFPTVEFRTARGETIIFASRVGGGRRPVAGAQVDVLYDPECPREAEIVTFQALWVFPVVTSVFSSPFLIVGLLGVFHRL